MIKYSLLFCALVVAAAVADTPANCSYDEIVGRWDFHVGSAGHDNTLECLNYYVEKKVKVILSFPDVATDEQGNEGFWTLIYNQGFEVVLNGRKYFAFSLYKQDNKTVTSLCHSTFPGWSHDLQGNDWACYYGTKEKSSSQVTAKLPPKTPFYSKYDLDQKYVRNLDFIAKINRRTNLWEATHYPELEKMTYRERLMRAGGVPIRGPNPYPKKAPVTADQLEAVRDFPENFDWRSNNGTNYVSPIRNQGKCGSCYAFGSMAMLEARIRLASNNSMQPVFSTQDIVSCSEYSQGCEGGFPYLIAGKYGEDFGVVEESCLPYAGSDSVPCSREKVGCRRYRTTDYYYIGGYYGACNDVLMQMELVKRGPIAVSFEVTKEFQSYKKGIFHHVDVGDDFNPWEVTNHVVSVVGYGAEDGVRFWTVKNSWGESWGEQGYFRIMRGADELSIESMAVAVTPVLPK